MNLSWPWKKKTAAASEMVCPVEGRKLKRRVLGEIVVDECPLCHGVWLKDDVIGRLVEHAQKLGVQEKLLKRNIDARRKR